MKNDDTLRMPSRRVLQPLRTLLVDDSHLILACLRRLLDREPLLQVVDTANTGVEALEKAAALTPDLVLMDLHMPGLDGLQTTAQMRESLPHVRIIIMTLDEIASSRAAARAHGAHGFVEKARIPNDLMAEIRRVCPFAPAFDPDGDA